MLAGCEGGGGCKDGGINADGRIKALPSTSILVGPFDTDLFNLTG